jgi:glycosyltransferase involved in cell wall biosynthesis
VTNQADILFLDHVGVLGGAELSLRDVACHFGDRGRVVLLADGPFRELLEQCGVDVDVVAAAARLTGTRRDANATTALRSIPSVVRLIGRLYPHARRSKLLYANSQKAFVVASLLGVLARRPVIWHLRDVLSEEHFSATNRRVTTRLARLSRARVIANSDATRDALIDAGGRADRVVTIHNGIAPDPFDAVEDADVTTVRNELGLDPSTWLIGAFSRLATWKGQHVLIEALAQTPGVHGVIVGEALFGEQRYRERLCRQIDQLNLTDRVHMLGFRDDVPRLMKACNAIAHTSIAPEPFGRVIVEGMLARRPVIASRAGGGCEIITGEDHGILVTPGDPSDLADAIDRLRGDEAWAERLAAGGRRRAEATFSVKTMLERIEEQITATLTNGRQPAPNDAHEPNAQPRPGPTVSHPKSPLP